MSEILKEAKITVVSALIYDRKKRDFAQVIHVVVHLKEDIREVEAVRAKLRKKGAVFEGKIEDLPLDEQNRLYEEAKAKAIRWWEVECGGCRKFVDLFEQKFYRVAAYKDLDEELFCEECNEKNVYAPDEEISDDFLAKAIESKKPAYNVPREIPDVAIVLVEGKKRLIFQKTNPRAFEALKKFGKRGDKECIE